MAAFLFLCFELYRAEPLYFCFRNNFLNSPDKVFQTASVLRLLDDGNRA